MIRTALLSGIATLTLAIPVAAQEVSSMRIFTEPAGVRYAVDGQLYSAPTNFLWPKGSKHVVAIETPVLNTPQMRICEEAGNVNTQFDEKCTTRYGFSGWETNHGTAPATVTTY